MQIGVRCAPVEVAFVAPEITPYSRSGELGDVCAALPKALRSIGHKVCVISPLWSGIDPSARGLARRLSGVEVTLGATRYACTLHDGRTTGGVELVFVGQAELFAASKQADRQLQLEGALVLAEAAAQVLAARAPAPEVVHVHGWFAAATLPLLAQALHQAVRVLSLHDVQEQGALNQLRNGVVAPDAVRELAGTGADGSLLCAGVLAARRVIASSQAEVHGLIGDERLSPRLRQALSEEGKVVGIPNGLDAARWNPLTDPLLPSRFDPVSSRGKARCKDALQLELNLPIRSEAALVALISGSDAPSAGALAAIAPSLLRNDVQLLVVGGEAAAHSELRALASANPERLRLLPTADERTQHRVVAAADFLLVLAHEPSHGDLHLCAQRYGALPIVDKSSVMADAVVDCDAELTTGSGFAFEGPGELLATLQRALAAFAKGSAFDALRRRVMQLDVSWERSARRYEYLYNSLKNGA